jgi:hypothetical protein
MQLFASEAWKQFGEPILVFLVVGAPVGWTTAGAFRSHLYTLGFLSAAALVFLGYALFDFDYYLNLPHHYAMDDVRCALLTPLEKGLVYVLPSRGYGFGAVYCPRLQSEQAVLEENRAWLEPLDMVKDDPNNKWTIGKCRAALRRILLFRTQKVELDEDIIKDLAYWLYWHRRDFKPLDTPTTSVSTVPNTNPTPTAEESNQGAALSSLTERQPDNPDATTAPSAEPTTSATGTLNATEDDLKKLGGPRCRLEKKLEDDKTLSLTKRERLWYRLQTDKGLALKDIVRDRFPDLHPRGCHRRHNNDLGEDCDNDNLHNNPEGDNGVKKNRQCRLLDWLSHVFHTALHGDDSKSQKHKEASTDLPLPPLLGRDVVMALVQWEYLVFEWRWKLDEAMRADIWRLRSPKYSGAGFADQLPLPPQRGEKCPTMGSRSGFDGFKDAVGEVYRLLAGADPTTIQDGKRAADKKKVKEEEKVEEEKKEKELKEIVKAGQKEVQEVLKLSRIQALAPRLRRQSVAYPWTGLGKKTRPGEFTIEIYAGEVWDKCWAECPSTFGALYLWLTVWYVDVGNEGFHTTPLVPPGQPSDWDYDGADYMSVWRMGWRHAWHVAIICQLVIMLPTIISTFLCDLNFCVRGRRVPKHFCEFLGVYTCGECNIFFTSANS